MIAGRAVFRTGAAAALCVAICGLLPGCQYFLPGDGGTAIAGRIVDEKGQPRKGCRLELLSSDGRVFIGRAVDDQFLVTFTVAPFTATYGIRISCPNPEAVFVSGPVELGGETSEKPFDLGPVVVKPL